MKISIATSDILQSKADLIALNLIDARITPNTALARADKSLNGDLSRLIKKEKLKGTAGQSKLVRLRGDIKGDYLCLLGLGETKSATLDVARRAGAALQATAKQTNAETVALEIPAYGRFQAETLVQAFLEGYLLNGYVFSRYKKAEPSTVRELQLFVKDAKKKVPAERAAALAQDLAQAVCLARDLINTPAADMTPVDLAEAAKKLKGVRVKIHDLEAIKRLKMGSYLSVAAGSTKNPPRFIEMHYAPKGKPKKKIAIIGKGVTFDTGGYSIKPAKSMETMKDDMSGAAAVIAIMSLLPKIQPKVAVSGYVAATENMVSGFAQRPGDICTAMDGTTIEVLNTDAEGRLTLADAILFAKKSSPDLIIDMATLTGACMVSLGLLYGGIMGNDRELIHKLISTAKENGENLWHLPLPEEYKEEIKSPIADLKNVGGPWGGTLTAGLFLQHFAGETKWAHIDIAGPAWTDKALPYTPRGGTGIMVRTITDSSRIIPVKSQRRSRKERNLE